MAESKPLPTEEGVPPDTGDALLAEISVLRPRALSKRAEQMGIDEDLIEAADEGSPMDRKMALINLIVKEARAKEAAEAAAAEVARLAVLKAELMSMSATKISRKAVEMGIADEDIETADEAPDRKGALVALVLSFETTERLSAEDAQLKAELESMSAMKISKRAADKGLP